MLFACGKHSTSLLRRETDEESASSGRRERKLVYFRQKSPPSLFPFGSTGRSHSASISPSPAALLIHRLHQQPSECLHVYSARDGVRLSCNTAEQFGCTTNSRSSRHQRLERRFRSIIPLLCGKTRNRPDLSLSLTVGFYCATLDLFSPTTFFHGSAQ